MNKLKDLIEKDRPLEKCLEQGAKVLNDSELLALLLGNGSPDCDVLNLSCRIINGITVRCNEHESFYNYALLNYRYLSNFPGIGKVKISRIMAAIELGLRIAAANPVKKLPLVNRPDLVAKYLYQEMSYLDHEEIYGVFLNTANRVIKVQHLATGGLDKCMLTPRDIYHYALACNSASIILAHNHPSGNLEPSKADLVATQKYCNLGNELCLPLVDHLIIAGHNYVSLRSVHPEIFLPPT